MSANTNTLPNVGTFLTSFIKRNKVVVATAPVLGAAKRFPHGIFFIQQKRDTTLDKCPGFARTSPRDN